MQIQAHRQGHHRRHQQRKQNRQRHMVVHRPIIGLIAGLVLAGGPPTVAAGVLRVGVLDHSPPCAERVGPGRWDGKAVELWRQIAERQRLPYVLQGYPTPQSLL